MKPLILILCLGLMACGSSKSGGSFETSEQHQRFTYELKETVNGVECTTDRHTATDVKVLCQVLGDETLNHKCAADERLRSQREYNCSNVTPVSIAKYSVPGCVGEIHYVDAKEKLCEALRSEFLNGSCGKSARGQKIKELGC